MSWPTGSAPFNVRALLERGRALDAGTPDPPQVDGMTLTAGEIISTLAAYVASLPEADQKATARRLVGALKPRIGKGSKNP